jgi:hypothetical protein
VTRTTGIPRVPKSSHVGMSVYNNYIELTATEGISHRDAGWTSSDDDGGRWSIAVHKERLSLSNILA